MNSLEEITGTGRAVMIYFFSDSCNVCRELRPKVRQLVNSEFPEMKFVEIDVSINQAISVSANVYSAPTVLVWFDSKEYIRENRYISITELEKKIRRYYDMIF